MCVSAQYSSVETISGAKVAYTVIQYEIGSCREHWAAGLHCRLYNIDSSSTAKKFQIAHKIIHDKYNLMTVSEMFFS